MFGDGRTRKKTSKLTRNGRRRHCFPISLCRYHHGSHRRHFQLKATPSISDSTGSQSSILRHVCDAQCKNVKTYVHRSTYVISALDLPRPARANICCNVVPVPVPVDLHVASQTLSQLRVSRVYRKTKSPRFPSKRTKVTVYRRMKHESGV